VADADIICIPYNLLLQESARTASGIDIENNVIILDEAHNVIDAINSMHSITINSIELKATLMQLEKYYERYKSRLSGKNSLYIKQLKLVCEQLLKFRGLEENKKDSMLLGVPEYVEQLEIEHVNLFKLLNFLKETKLSNKLQGFSEKAKTKLQVNSSDEKLYLSTHSSPLRQLEQLFGTLNNPDEDGRVIISKADGILHIKYLLLNPANAFRNVIEQARSVIFAGGTMEPMNDFCQQLFPHLSQERIHRFSCGHVIPKKQLTTVSLSAGPSGQELLFSYEHRNKPNLV
jgi:chromosome transmission fidelity protein 1